MSRKPLGKTGIHVPSIVFGTSCLGNLYQVLPEDTKFLIMQEWFQHVDAPVILDTAGKYGAGLCLEVMGKGFNHLGIPPDDVVISNKLGWKRIPLNASAELFEPGVWEDLEFNAMQDMSADGMIECWRQGCDLLGERFAPQLVSVHDPDDYVMDGSPENRFVRWNHILDAFRGLEDLREKGDVLGVGVGAKDWTMIRKISEEIDLDWVMLANCFTVMHHPPDLIQFMEELSQREIGIINAAVYHGGFLTGGDFLDYVKVDPEKNRSQIEWRSKFEQCCVEHGYTPAEICVQFGISHPAIQTVALNTSRPERIKENVNLTQKEIDASFWTSMKEAGLIDRNYKYVG